MPKSKKTTVSKPEHIKRPSNCFILFRADLAERMRNEDKTAARRADGGVAQASRRALDQVSRIAVGQVSRTAGQLWKGMSASERKPWVDRARRAKDEHQLKHPNYQFRPQKREEKTAEKKNKSLKIPSSASRGSKTRRLVAEARESSLDPISWHSGSSSSSLSPLTSAQSSSSSSGSNSIASTPPPTEASNFAYFDPGFGDDFTQPLGWMQHSSPCQSSSVRYSYDNNVNVGQQLPTQPLYFTEPFYPATQYQLTSPEPQHQWPSQDINSANDAYYRFFSQDQPLAPPVEQRPYYNFAIDPLLLDPPF